MRSERGRHLEIGTTQHEPRQLEARTMGNELPVGLPLKSLSIKSIQAYISLYKRNFDKDLLTFFWRQNLKKLEANSSIALLTSALARLAHYLAPKSLKEFCFVLCDTFCLL